MSSESFPATYQRTAYVAVTRGKQQAQIFTDDREELLRAFCRADAPLSATDLSQAEQEKQASKDQLAKRLAFARGLEAAAARKDSLLPGSATDAVP